MEHHSTTEGNDCRSLAQFVHRVINGLHGGDAFFFKPTLNGLSQTWSVHKARLRAKQLCGLPHSLLLLSRHRLVLGNLREAGIRHLRHQNTSCQTILHVLMIEAAVEGTIGTEDHPVVGHVDLTRLCLIAIVVLTPFSTVKGIAVDIILSRPVACTIGLS